MISRMGITIYHNPRCSQSRKALALLEKSGCEVHVVEYLKNPPDYVTIENLVSLLGLTDPRGMMRTQDDLYKENNLDDPELGADALIQAMADNPALIERPIVMTPKRALIARPPERVRDLL